MIEDIPAIRTAPIRRRGQFVGASKYLRKRRGPSTGTLLLWWLSSGLVGIAIGYLVLFYGFEKDPIGLGEFLPSVEVQWPASAK